MNEKMFLEYTFQKPVEDEQSLTFYIL